MANISLALVCMVDLSKDKKETKEKGKFQILRHYLIKCFVPSQYEF